MYMKIFFLFTLCFFLVSTSPGQRSIGEVKKNDKLASDTLIDVPPKYWFGKRFIFLETSKMLQEFGYNLHFDEKLVFISEHQS
ncbi:MAG: hypothetical protein KKG06_00640 [Bacteroidetes bacterium]|nr:hypothetical protein [Bacteroidota bacterium]MBU1421686.1 hypothetical protein [Bacteroidota bacterium]